MRLSLGRLWRTVRYLKPVQVFGRIAFRLGHPVPNMSGRPSVRGSGLWRWVSPPARPSAMDTAGRFHFVGLSGSLRENGWDDASMPQLWRYHLHYFDELCASEAAERWQELDALLAQWVRENPPGVGTGWEPYPTSRRIVNWVKWSRAGHRLSQECLQSLAVQARWLEQRIEWHLQGNHLIANAKGLLFAGVFFDGDEAARWCKRGRDILLPQLEEQVLSDGGHFERSTMYHALVLEDLLDLYNVLGGEHANDAVSLAEVRRSVREHIGSMRYWLDAMTHPDGEISFFNDAAFGMALPPTDLERYAARLQLPPVPLVYVGATALPETGYVRLSNLRAKVFCDVAPVGPDFQPGHAHADTLSFELSLFGRRIFVNSGTSVYAPGPERLRQRGTAAHNTLSIGAADSTEVWASFRVGRRAYPHRVALETSTTSMTLAAEHDGYSVRRRRVTHHRTWTLKRDQLLVTDRLEPFSPDATARFHLHPDCIRLVTLTGPDTAVIQLPSGGVLDVIVAGGSLQLEPTTWHPRFGESVPNECLVVRCRAQTVVTTIEWAATS